MRLGAGLLLCLWDCFSGLGVWPKRGKSKLATSRPSLDCLSAFKRLTSGIERLIVGCEAALRLCVAQAEWSAELIALLKR